VKRIAGIIIVIVGLLSATAAWADGPPEPANVSTTQLPKTSPVPLAHSSSTILADNLATVQAAPAAVYNEAARITTQAQYDAASPAAQQLFSTPVKMKEKVKSTPVAPPPKPASTSGVGTGYDWPPSCWWVKMTDSSVNFLGWALWTNNVQVNNWCWVYNLYGYWVIYSQPWHAYWVTSHWGWASCGMEGYLEGFNDPPFQWGTAETWEFGRIVGLGSVDCIPDPFRQLNVTQETGVWVYGYGRYDYI
jgi:hypothetical protein